MRIFRRIRRKLPQKHEVENNPSLSFLRSFWKKPELWAMNRSSLPIGIAIGVFCAFLPMPFQMIVAALLAIALGGNIIFAISLVWISNPFTWVPLYTPCYWIGAQLLNIEPLAISSMTSFTVSKELGYHYAALWIGCLVIGIIISLVSFFLLRIIWRRQVQFEWTERKQKRLLRNKLLNTKQRNSD